MSASNKKKLRKEQEAAMLTEKQRSAAQEAKKVRLYTAAFTAVLAVLLVVALVVGVTQTIENTGMKEKNTVAMTVGDHKINSVEMNYFFMDTVNNFYSYYGDYASIFGLDLTLPLNEQVTNEETGATWADDFLTSAKETAKEVYVKADAAKAAGFTLTAEQTAQIEEQLASYDLYAAMYGYSSANDYLKAVYGNGANTKSYTEYMELRTLASAYDTHYSESLTYDDAALDAEDQKDPASYSSFSYEVQTVYSSDYLPEGTVDADGNVTYTDEEQAAALAAAKEAADAIAAAKTVDGTEFTDVLAKNVDAAYAEWIKDTARKAGDVTVVENTYGDGYNVVSFVGTTDNEFTLKNVRHILVAFEHDHDAAEEDHDHSTSTYTDEELAEAKATAEDILAQWQAGEATEESFALLANEKSADGDGTTGGLYEDVYPGQMVTNFEDWCYDAARKPGDTGIVESTYGYHVMYFVGDSETSYRDYMIANTLRSADYSAWSTGLSEAATVTDGSMAYVMTDLVIQRAE